MIRTNLCPNPRYLGTDMKQGGGSALWAQEDLPIGGPDGTSRTVITADTEQTGDVALGTDPEDDADVTPGETYTGSAHLMFGQGGQTEVSVQLWWRDGSGTKISTDTGPTSAPEAPGIWGRYSATGVAPPGAVAVTTVAVFGYGTTGTPLAPGDTVSIAQRMVEQSPTVGPYFDGGSPNPPLAVNSWTGVPDASPSTQAIAEVSAALLTTGQPQPVQVLVTDLPAGTTYEVVGVGPSGRSWGIPGGTGVSDGDQVRLVDRRAPVNVPVHYEVYAAQTTLSSNEVTVAWAPADGLNYVFLQSLDGSEVVSIRKWLDNGMPDTYGVRSTVFDVHGRTRPVVVLSGATEGSTPVQVILSRTAGEQVKHILEDLGGAICLRTDTKLRDLPPSDLAVMTTASSILYSGDGGVGTARRWDVSLTWIDDPEPDTVPVVWTVDDVDELLGTTLGLTVDEVDAMFAGQTVDDVDATDWGSLA